MKRLHRVDTYRRGAGGARDEYGDTDRAPQPVPGGAGVPCNLVPTSLVADSGAGLRTAPYGLVPESRFLGLFPVRGFVPNQGDYLVADEWGGPRRFLVGAVVPLGGRFDTVATLTETAETFGPPAEPAP